MKKDYLWVSFRFAHPCAASGVFADTLCLSSMSHGFWINHSPWTVSTVESCSYLTCSLMFFATNITLSLLGFSS